MNTSLRIMAGQLASSVDQLTAFEDAKHTLSSSGRMAYCLARGSRQIDGGKYVRCS